MVILWKKRTIQVWISVPKIPIGTLVVLILDIVASKLERRNEAKKERKDEEFCPGHAMSESYEDRYLLTTGNI